MNKKNIPCAFRKLTAMEVMMQAEWLPALEKEWTLLVDGYDLYL
jgi:hypothetical protein